MIIKQRILVGVSCLAIGLSLSACWVPEEFHATLDIEEDGSYTFVYDGVLTYAVAAAAAAEGKLDKKTELELKGAEEELRQDTSFKKVNYLGEGRYQVGYELSGGADDAFAFLSEELKIISLRRNDSGGLEVAGLELKEEDVQKFDEIGIEVDGVLEVKTDAEVIAHNAPDTPFLFGLLGSYKWTINSPKDPAPSMQVRIDG